MGSERYAAGIRAGCVQSSRGVYLDGSVRWPAFVAELGPRQGGQPLGRCIACEPQRHEQYAMTFVRYGGHPLCRDHASALASGADLPFVRDALKRVRLAVEAERRARSAAGDQRPEGLLFRGGDECRRK